MSPIFDTPFFTCLLLSIIGLVELLCVVILTSQSSPPPRPFLISPDSHPERLTQAKPKSDRRAFNDRLRFINFSPSNAKLTGHISRTGESAANYRPRNGDAGEICDHARLVSN
ncbi:hypothetical protein PUN28_007028 [Cardiocondyla obscurior]|uniref:Secreted protein n=1 Tax=Cardiocondyla obscurior TaxID=286306 RepID=A0AAW2G7C1_9HYME